MATSVMQRQFDDRLIAGLSLTSPGSAVELTNENEAETLKFLAARPIHTVFLASLISDNGMASPFNRGSVLWLPQPSGISRRRGPDRPCNNV